MNDHLPQRIVCLTEETTETLYILGEQHRIVGISGYTVRPPEARREKPRVSAFTTAKTEKILALEPDLVLGFSDLQADIAAELIRRGLNVYVFNQRSVRQILEMVVTLGSLVGAQHKALRWVGQIEHDIRRIEEQARHRAETTGLRGPKVYFEEWYDPLITGIRWVSEIIEIAGGRDCFAELSGCCLAKDRIIADPRTVVDRRPDIIIGSWCGRKFRPQKLRERDGWQAIPAVTDGQVFEIKSADILQPGPAALTDGLAQVKTIIDRWYSTRLAQDKTPRAVD